MEITELLDYWGRRFNNDNLSDQLHSDLLEELHRLYIKEQQDEETEIDYA